MMTIVLLVLAAGVTVAVVKVLSVHSDDLGSVSQQWLAEHRAAEASPNR